MITKLLQGQKMLRACGFISACALATTVLAAQKPAARIAREVNVAQMSLLKGSQHPLAQAQHDAGRMPANSQLKGMSIVFNRSAAQQADLDALLAAQQNPASPLYHQWLTPEQFAARFGMAQSDIDKVQTWLEQQGFSVDSVARSRNLIRFSGNAGQVEQAFQTEMHFYNLHGEKHFAPATALSLPTAVVSSVATVGNLDDFRPRPMHIRSNSVQPRANFTSGVSGSVFLAPGDIATIYNLKPLLSASVNGTGQSIAILGQSSVVTSDLEAFQTAAKLAKKDPTMVIVPGSGGSQAFQGDESESDLDLEWSSAIAPGADVFFVYTGSDPNFGVFDSLQYAVDEKIANIISISYGACEPNISAANIATLDAILSQGASQGQTILAASGDAGSTACYQSPTTTNPTLAVQEGLAVSYPASSQYVTGVGGTEISQTNAAYYTQGSAYWTAETAGTDILNSALQYIPEVVWNDDAAAVQGGNTSLSSAGGGVSTIYKTKPSWQTGVPGIPSDNARDVPDISLLSSPAYVPYLYCSSDTAAWSTGQTASCSNGTFRDSSQNLTLAGGTSFATPVFAGMLAILNQQKGYTTGQGLLNTELYKLAANSATYAAVFHDITSGSNACPSSLGASYCSGAATTSYSAAAGYDLATGLGSFDLDKLVAAWPAATTTLIATTTTVSAASTTPDVKTNDAIAIKVAQASGAGIPTGTVNLSIDGAGSAYGASGSTPTPVTLNSSGSATYTANFTTCGVHTIVAQYLGDATHAPSTGSVTITVGSASACTFTMALTPATLTVKQGSQGTETLALTPGSAYTGKVNLSYDTSNNTALTNLCVFAGTGVNSDGSITVASSTAVSGQITIDTKASDCTTGGAISASGLRSIPHGTGMVKPSNNAPKKNNRVPVGMAFVGLLLAGFLGRSSRKLRQVACVIVLASLGLALSACGSSSGSTTGGSGGTTVPNPAKGTYTITFTGTDSVTNTITAQSSFSLVIN